MVTIHFLSEFGQGGAGVKGKNVRTGNWGRDVP
jgi:hypothetical protein